MDTSKEPLHMPLRGDQNDPGRTADRSEGSADYIRRSPASSEVQPPDGVARRVGVVTKNYKFPPNSPCCLRPYDTVGIVGEHADYWVIQHGRYHFSISKEYVAEVKPFTEFCCYGLFDVAGSDDWRVDYHEDIDSFTFHDEGHYLWLESVNYCPFCGSRLPEVLKKSDKKYEWFRQFRILADAAMLAHKNQSTE